MKKIVLLTSILFPLIFGSCAKVYVSRGDKHFNDMAYEKAIFYYETGLRYREIPSARKNLAESYRLVNNSRKAEVNYRKVNELDNKAPENWLYYGKALMMNSKYEEARAWIKAYLDATPGNNLAACLFSSCEKAIALQKDSTLYKVQLLNIAGVSSAFSAAMYNGGIVFSANQDVARASKKDPWTGKSYLNLYYTQKRDGSTWTTPVALNGDINGGYHDGVAAFSPNGKHVYFTRNNYTGKKLRTDDKNVSNLRLYRAEFKNGMWTQIVDMHFNSDFYSTGHAALSPDGKKLYLISDMPGGYGGTDIYVCDVFGDAISFPRNLGPNVNTPGNEMFPTFNGEENALYFSSEGHDNLGGLDIFKVAFENNEWSKPVNLGYPINTSQDDFAYVAAEGGLSGYISSNRSGTDQIYEFTKAVPEVKLTLEGVVTLKGSSVPLQDVIIRSMDASDSIVRSVITDALGRFSVELEPNKIYKVYASRNDVFTATAEISTMNIKSSATLNKNLEVEEIVIDKPIVLENIYYDMDKWDIRPDAALALNKLVTILKDNPNINIELNSHTDKWGSDSYNLVLSDKRARSAVKYVISQGIAGSRITAKGYGETRPVNHCVNGVKCTAEEDAANRRTEFKVIKINEAKPVLTNR